MREIKFRAWDKELNKMIYDFSDTFGDARLETYIISQLDNLAIGVYKEGEGDGLPLPIMQFTGLKDKNGKEIYEGDIVEYENGNSGYGRPRHEEINRDVVPDLTKYEDIFDGSMWWQDGEVVGNIYENGELI